LKFDRQQDDVGNILALEHVNLRAPDQSLATQFYVGGLGFTRDPYMDFGPYNVWVNAGNQQFHLPRGEPQVLRGCIGVVVPSLSALAIRLGRIERRMADTRFGYKVQKSSVVVTCPWGNLIKCSEPSRAKSNLAAPRVQLGIQYVEFQTRREDLAGIARFYTQYFDAPTKLTKNTCEVSIGRYQTLRFRASTKSSPYDGHHIAIYTVDFSGPYKRLKKKNLIAEESDQHQYRFDHIIDPDSGRLLYELEHEVRSLHHPMFSRKLVNRNAEQSFANYRVGADAFYPG